MPTQKKRTADSDAAKNGSTKSNSQTASSSKSDRVIAVTAVDGHTGSSLVELLLSDPAFEGRFAKVVGLSFGEPGPDAKDVLDEYGVETMPADALDDAKLKDLGVDTLCLIPPARKVRPSRRPVAAASRRPTLTLRPSRRRPQDKLDLVKQVLEVGKKAKNVQNLVFVSSAGCDYAERDKQPHLREFIDLEVRALALPRLAALGALGLTHGRLQVLAMAPKSDPSTEDTGHSPCIVRCVLPLCARPASPALTPFAHPAAPASTSRTSSSVRRLARRVESVTVESPVELTFPNLAAADSKQAQGEGKLPIPIDEDHKFAPVRPSLAASRSSSAQVLTQRGARAQVALGDVCLLLAKILTSTGEHGLADDVRGSMIPLTGTSRPLAPSHACPPSRERALTRCTPRFLLAGPQLTAGPELAEAASQALGAPLKFHSVREGEAKKILQGPQGQELDDSERAYLLECVHPSSSLVARLSFSLVLKSSS